LELEKRKKEIEEDIDWVCCDWLKIVLRQVCKKVKEEGKTKIEESRL